jgi:hypothetical protein
LQIALGEIRKFFLSGESRVPGAAFVPGVRGESAVKRAPCAPEYQWRAYWKWPFDRHICDSKICTRAPPPLGRMRAILQRREAESPARTTRATTLCSRFLNVEDVFFLPAVVIENAVPTIRVGADATSTTWL